MKKLLLLAAIGVAGLVSASNDVVLSNGNYENIANIVSENSFQIETVEKSGFLIREYDWLEVETWCGKVFYLNNNDYNSFEEVAADANYFTDQQCGPYPG